MGQYYKCVILKNDWKETNEPVRAALSSYDFDNGAKLMEHSYVHNKYVSAFMHLIHELDTDRSGLPCVWCGDYADTFATEGLPMIERINHDTQESELVGGFQAYDEACNWMNEYDDNKSNEYLDVIELVKDAPKHYYNYIINHTKKQYVEVPKYDKTKWQIHPLPILLSDGSGRGSGDYNDEICINPEETDYCKRKYVKKHNAQFVGLWAYDTISVTNRKADTEGYTKIDWEPESEE